MDIVISVRDLKSRFSGDFKLLRWKSISYHYLCYYDHFIYLNVLDQKTSANPKKEDELF